MDSLQLRRRFLDAFRQSPSLLSLAPGRVNLIGEHTDYNEGFVLPIALEQATYVLAAPREDDQIDVLAAGINDQQKWPIDEWESTSLPAWTAYVAGVAILLRRHGLPIQGANLYITSDVPVGGGLSSSAALEVAAANAFLSLANTHWEPTEIADLARACEHEFAGVPCGIMDQYISVLGEAEHALLLDCRDQTWEQIPFHLGEHAVLIVNSGVKHRLASGEYAKRQQECQEALRFFQTHDPSISSLRDVSAQQVSRAAGKLDGLPLRRVRHVTSETERTLAASQALRNNELATFGRHMYASHASLRDDYEVSCAELDQLVEIARRTEGVLGARMTGGGFGGCIVALVHNDQVESLMAAVEEGYSAAGFGSATFLRSQPSQGACIKRLD